MVCQERLMRYTPRDYTLEVKDMSSQRLKTEVFTPER